MKHRIFLTTFFAFILTLHLGCEPSKRQEPNAQGTIAAVPEQQESYWTCSMHPHIHKTEAGKCPICGMPLVHVDRKVHPDDSSSATSVSLEPSEVQIKNANISRYTVVRKDFATAISFSGRLTSARDVSLQIYESDSNIVKPNMDISGYASVNASQIMKGKITHLDSFIDPSSRTIRVLAVLDSSVSGYIADSSFYGKIQSNLKNQLTVPEEAIMHTGKRELVYIFNQQGGLESREVILGQKNATEYQILSGLKEGDVISAGANFLIDSEAKIRGF